MKRLLFRNISQRCVNRYKSTFVVVIVYLLFSPAAWPELLDFNTPDSKRTLHEIFETGLAHSPNGPCLGRRPVISKNPVKYAPYYTWETYTQVDQRRRNVGSALDFLWQQGRAGGGDLPTVGLWTQNCPGESSFVNTLLSFLISAQNGKLPTLPHRRMQKSPLACMILSVQTQSVCCSVFSLKFLDYTY